MPLSTLLHPEGRPYVEPEPMSCSRVCVDCLTWVRVTGEVDCSGAPALAEALRVPPAEVPLLVMVDMREVTFLDVSGAHVLLDANDVVAREGGRLVVIRGPVAFDWWFPLLELHARVEVIGVEADGSRAPDVRD